MRNIQQIGYTASVMAGKLGYPRQIMIDTTNQTVVVHDGATAGGYAMARADLANVRQATTTQSGIMSTAYAQLVEGSVQRAGDTVTGVINFTAQPTYLGGTIWASTNDGNGSGLDADLVRGLASASIATPSTVVTRDASGNSAFNQIDATTLNATTGVFTTTLTLNGSGVWTAANDGAGSGLDADLLDGYNASFAGNVANTVVVRDGSAQVYAEGFVLTQAGANAGLFDADASGIYLRPYDDAAWQTTREFGYLNADNRWFSETSLHLATNNTFLVGELAAGGDVSLVGVDGSNVVQVGDTNRACVLNRYDAMIRGNSDTVTNTVRLRLGNLSLTDQAIFGYLSSASATLSLVNAVAGGAIEIKPASSANNAARTLLAGGVSLAQTDGALVIAEGVDYGGAGLGGDVALIPAGDLGVVKLYTRPAGSGPTIIGTAADTTNRSFLAFANNAGGRWGLVGYGNDATYDLNIKNEQSGGHLNLQTTGAGVPQVNGNTIYHTGNDGSGSGLDADLWDGNQFATYLNQALLTTSSPTFANATITTALTVAGSNVRTFANTAFVNSGDGGPYVSAVELDISSSSGTWWTVNTATWSALSAVPSGASWIKIRLLVAIGATGTFIMYARLPGSGLGTTLDTEAYAGSNGHATLARAFTAEITIPISGTPTFDIYTVSTGGTPTVQEIRLVGFG